MLVFNFYNTTCLWHNNIDDNELCDGIGLCCALWLIIL